MSSDLRAAIRRRKPDRRRSPLVFRNTSELSDWTALANRSPPTLLVDTTVYVHRAAGRLPAALRAIIDRSLLFHCTAAIAEIAIGVAKWNPARSDWKAVRDHYAALFETIPPSRLLNPDAQVWVEAGIIAGTLARTQGFQPHQHRECLNDALIFLTAAKFGLPVLTANRNDFDLIQQLVPEGQFVFY